MDKTRIKITSTDKLIRDILEIANEKHIAKLSFDDEEKDIDDILFSLGFPPSDTTIKLEWVCK